MSNELKELTELVAELRVLHGQKTDAKKIHDESVTNYKEVELKILGILEENDLKQFRVEGEGLASITERFSVQTPKSNQDKKLLFDYLAKQEIFYDNASVPSRTLNKLFEEEFKNQLSQGNADWRMPGVGDPIVAHTLSFRKA